MAKRRRVYPAKDKEAPKRFSKFSNVAPGGHSFRVNYLEDTPRKFTKLPAFSPANHTFRVSYMEDSAQKIDDPANFSSSNQKFRPFDDSLRNSDDILPSFISHTVRVGSPVGNTTRQELSSFSPVSGKRRLYPSDETVSQNLSFTPLNQRPRVYPSDDTGLEFTNLTNSNPTVTHTKELIKQAFNL